MLYVPTMLLLLSSCAHPSPSPLLRVLGKKALLDFPSECWHGPAQSDIQSSLSNHYQSHPGSDLSIFPLCEAFFFSFLFFFFFALPELTAGLIQSGQAGCERRGAAVQRSHSRKEETEKKKKKGFPQSHSSCSPTTTRPSQSNLKSGGTSA